MHKSFQISYLSDAIFSIVYLAVLIRGYFTLFFHICSSEFEELEAVPTSAVVEGPLEPPPTSSAAAIVPDVPDDSFVNFFSVCSFVDCKHESCHCFPACCSKPCVTLSGYVALHERESPIKSNWPFHMQCVPETGQSL